MKLGLFLRPKFIANFEIQRLELKIQRLKLEIPRIKLEIQTLIFEFQRIKWEKRHFVQNGTNTLPYNIVSLHVYCVW